ncbi:MAG: hypothetical protein K2X81_17675 [Candidatus Obscuribacterales bacterium]|nr:hypothetical protein [Candidatus Obscuribacterales bacterium]
MRAPLIITSLFFVIATAAIAQNPYDPGKLDASTSQTATASTGTVSNAGLKIDYQISGIKNINDVKFNQKSWNNPGDTHLVAEPDASDIRITGTVSATEGGTDPYIYRIAYWWNGRPGVSSVMHNLVQKTVTRPFEETFDVSVPVSKGPGILGIQVLLMDDSTPGSPSTLSSALGIEITPGEDAPATPEWTQATGKGPAGLLAVAAAAAALAVVWKAKQKNGKEQKDNTAGYVLQVSESALSLARGQSATLEITAWKVDSKGGYTAAPEAEIRIAPAVQNAGIVIQPASGHGKMTCEVSLNSDSGKIDESTLQITAVAGKSRFSSNVKVSIQNYELEFF